MARIRKWLAGLGLAKYAGVFAAAEVDLDVLRDLTEADLEKLGIPLGPRKKLLKAALALRAESSHWTLPAGTAPGRDLRSVRTEAERRQLTVMFIDLVGSTALSARLDPEDMRLVIRAYQDACSGAVARYDGFVAKFMGDGILAYFGYPRAHEDDAERAVRAGLEIAEAVRKVSAPTGETLCTRIGIATGLVVVGDLIGEGSAQEQAVVGDTPNLAARLQDLAEPGTVVIAGSTHRLLGALFRLRDLGRQVVKGLAETVQAWAVEGIASPESRFDAATHERLTPLVGREEELGLLQQRWTKAQNGEGQVVLLSGEPGIGKSRVLSALRGRLDTQGAQPLRFQCSPHYINSAFWPYVDNLERTLKFGRDETSEAKLVKLEALVVSHYGRPLSDVPFVASMLSIPCDDRYGALAMTPQRHKDETLRVLVDICDAAAHKQPSVILYEDLHWADPTSLEVLDLLIDRVRSMPLLIVLTCRPEFTAPWSQQGHVVTLNLSRFTRSQSAEMVTRVAGTKALPVNLVEQILTKTDGVPLFVEELTRSILESRELKDAGDRYEYIDTAQQITVPATLRDSLMARLDRAADVKRIAQVGSVIGREFGYELVAEVVKMGEPALSDTLSRLVASELASCRGAIPQAVYRFKHALVQDTAYESLLKSQRMTLHGMIAQALEKRSPKSRNTKPELLAAHYTAAGLFEAAVPYWRRAGELAMQRFALREAITHLNKGMSLIKELPPGPKRDLAELELRTVLGPAVVAQDGWAQGEVSRILEPAWTLTESLDHRPSYVPVLNSLWVHYVSVDRLALSLKSAQKMLAAGTATGDDSLKIVGYRDAIGSHFWLGDLLAARRSGDAVRAMYDPRRYWHIAEHTNTDPLTVDGIYRGQYLWMLGYPDQARAASDAKDEHARQRNHPFDLALALTIGAQVFDYLSEPEELLRRTEEAESVSRARGVAVLGEVIPEISRGIVSLREGRAADAVVQLDKAIWRLEATGQLTWIRYLRGLQGEGLALTGDLEAARALIDGSVLATENGEERVHYAELLRLKGWVLMLQGQPNGAEASLRASIDVARAQKAKSWELRSTTTLARLLAERQDRESAREMLSEVYGWFTEGFDTKDLKEAKALLDQLRDEVSP